MTSSPVWACSLRRLNPPGPTNRARLDKGTLTFSVEESSQQDQRNTAGTQTAHEEELLIPTTGPFSFLELRGLEMLLFMMPRISLLATERKQSKRHVKHSLCASHDARGVTRTCRLLYGLHHDLQRKSWDFNISLWETWHDGAWGVLLKHSVLS